MLQGVVCQVTTSLLTPGYTRLGSHIYNSILCAGVELNIDRVRDHDKMSRAPRLSGQVASLVLRITWVIFQNVEYAR